MVMKVCELVRLTKKDVDGNFEKGKEGRITVRNRVVVSEESVAEFEGNYKSTGLLYIVDAEATSERDAQVEDEVSELRGTKGFMQGLEEQEAAEKEAAAKETASKASAKATL